MCQVLISAECNQPVKQQTCRCIENANSGRLNLTCFVVLDKLTKCAVLPKDRTRSCRCLLWFQKFYGLQISVLQCEFMFSQLDYERQLMRLLPGREKSGLIINNPQQTMFLFVDKHVKQVSRFVKLEFRHLTNPSIPTSTGSIRTGDGTQQPWKKCGIWYWRVKILSWRDQPVCQLYLATELWRKTERKKIKAN